MLKHTDVPLGSYVEDRKGAYIVVAHLPRHRVAMLAPDSEYLIRQRLASIRKINCQPALVVVNYTHTSVRTDKGYYTRLTNRYIKFVKRLNH